MKIDWLAVFMISFIILCCGGFLSLEIYWDNRHANEYNAPFIEFAANNDNIVHVIHLNDTVTPAGKFGYVRKIGCIVEGSKTKQRKYLTINTNSSNIPLPGEIWKIKIVYYRDKAEFVLTEQVK